MAPIWDMTAASKSINKVMKQRYKIMKMLARKYDREYEHPMTPAYQIARLRASAGEEVAREARRRPWPISGLKKDGPFTIKLNVLPTFEQDEKTFRNFEHTTSQKYWKTANGVRVAIDSMAEEHLRNTISWAHRTLVRDSSSTLYLSDLRFKLRSLLDLLDEAHNRGYKV